MNSNNTFPGVWIILAILMVFASALIVPGIESGLIDFSAAQLFDDSVLCRPDQADTGSFPRLLISCNIDSILVETTLVNHQLQVNILLDGWDWKINQIIWQIPRT